MFSLDEFIWFSSRRTIFHLGHHPFYLFVKLYMYTEVGELVHCLIRTWLFKECDPPHTERYIYLKCICGYTIHTGIQPTDWIKEREREVRLETMDKLLSDDGKLSLELKYVCVWICEHTSINIIILKFWCVNKCNLFLVYFGLQSISEMLKLQGFLVFQHSWSRHGVEWKLPRCCFYFICIFPLYCER